ncbi:formin-like protein 14 [Polypterus senegalus]|uniref:formin-like protein 14 n=1 Tax=Polypterus senegalus TaxID=55291 RepID=UPI0019637823|nr:formin-like protein 14 [Polypterus senegalus]
MKRMVAALAFLCLLSTAKSASVILPLVAERSSEVQEVATEMPKEETVTEPVKGGKVEMPGMPAQPPRPPFSFFPPPTTSFSQVESKPPSPPVPGFAGPSMFSPFQILPPLPPLPPSPPPPPPAQIPPFINGFPPCASNGFYHSHVPSAPYVQYPARMPHPFFPMPRIPNSYFMYKEGFFPLPGLRSRHFFPYIRRGLPSLPYPMPPPSGTPPFPGVNPLEPGELLHTTSITQFQLPPPVSSGPYGKVVDSPVLPPAAHLRPPITSSFPAFFPFNPSGVKSHPYPIPQMLAAEETVNGEESAEGMQ